LEFLKLTVLLYPSSSAWNVRDSVGHYSTFITREDAVSNLVLS
jgi:hypothetical protein